MKKLIFLSVITVVSCNNINKNTENLPIISGEKDEHGCISSAGQSWSELRGECLQIFNEGIRLNPITKENNAVISAFVLFNKDKSKIEVFLPKGENIILDKKIDDIYTNNIYKYDNKLGILYINEIEVFKK